jgi:hypothetical protein
MQRFYFDVWYGAELQSDEDGLEFGDLDAAGRAAVAALVDMAKDEISDLKDSVLAIDVRDARRAMLLRVELKLEIRPEPSNRHKPSGA